MHFAKEDTKPYVMPPLDLVDVRMGIYDAVEINISALPYVVGIQGRAQEYLRFRCICNIDYNYLVEIDILSHSRFKAGTQGTDPPGTCTNFPIKLVIILNDRASTRFRLRYILHAVLSSGDCQKIRL